MPFQVGRPGVVVLTRPQSTLCCDAPIEVKHVPKPRKGSAVQLQQRGERDPAPFRFQKRRVKVARCAAQNSSKSRRSDQAIQLGRMLRTPGGANRLVNPLWWVLVVLLGPRNFVFCGLSPEVRLR